MDLHAIFSNSSEDLNQLSVILQYFFGAGMEIFRTRGRLWLLKSLGWPVGLACMFALVVVVAGFSEPSGELETINMTSGGMAWVTTMEGEELEQSDDKVTLVEQGDEPQGFASMDSMLQWAIGMLIS